MYRNTVLQQSPTQDDDHRARPITRDSNHASPSATLDRHHPSASSPTQPSFNPPPPTLQPSFNPSINSASPSQPALPSLSASLFSRETPVTKYYDPTQDAGDAGVNRRPRYEPYTSDVRETPPYAEARAPAPPPGTFDNPYRSPSNTNFQRPSPIHPPPNPFTPSRSDNMPASPLSPKVFSAVGRDQQPTFSSPGRPASRDTPARKADPMSLSNIISDNDAPPPTYSKHQDNQHTPKTHPARSDHGASPPPPVTPVRAPNKMSSNADGPMVNGHNVKPTTPEVNGTAPVLKARPEPGDVAAEYSRIDSMDLSDAEMPENDFWKTEYKGLAGKRIVSVLEAESSKRKRRRLYQSRRFLEIFEASASKGKSEYYQNNEAKAWREVQAEEAREEKERKKDMQRKRRREKALQNETLKREEAIERAENAVGEEKERALREIHKHEKKMRQTAKLLSGADVRELREVTPQGHNLEGGIMGSFQMSDDGARDGKKGRGARMSTRPRKSKEQKLAEKEQAAAAQAAIERGETLPAIAPREAARLRDLEDSDERSAKIDRRRERYTSKAYNQLFESIWKEMAKRDVGKVLRIKNESFNTKTSNLRKTAQLAGKEARRFQLRTNKSIKDVQARAKRSMREMLSFWRRNERDERDQRKMAERQELENAKRLEGEREAARQRRKLNFLLSQTELYSHFIEKKVQTSKLERSTDNVDIAEETETPPNPLDDLPDAPSKIGKKVTNFEDLDFDNEDETALREAAMANAQNALKEAQDRTKAFKDDDQSDYDDGEMNFQNPTSLQNMDIQQPALLDCQLKEYQLKGLNWLVNLYEQGINGILADEMGLGKTVQSISVMAYLAETHNIWGPFLVIAPASTLHNWQQEIARFVPDLKALPYWGTAKDRKVLRKFWERKKITYRQDAPFHVLITSYQLVVQDAQYFQRMTWQYMVLDEAQAIKSSQSSRWKSLLGFHCRNRLLLTGTPIQNNMQELWALLHFIMPTLFDSHDEFSEWFSKDIESHAQSNTKLNEDQLKRLHMILKPFMLRRIKKHVQKELGDKIELDVFCDLTYRQRAYYTSLRNKISLMDLIEKATIGDDQDTATLMNLVMQFRKVCNHPDLFERADTTSPLSFSYWAETASFVREGHFVNVAYSVRNVIEYKVPRLVYSVDRLDLPGPSNGMAGWRGKALYHMMNIFTPEYIDESSREDGIFSWLRFADVSAGEVAHISRQDLVQRSIDLRRRDRNLGKFSAIYEDADDYAPVTSMFNIVERNNRKPLAEIGTEGHLANLLNVSSNWFDESELGVMEPCARPGASAPPIALDCSSQFSNFETENVLFNVPVRTALYGVTPALDEDLVVRKVPVSAIPTAYDMLPEASQSKGRYTHITVPSMRRFVSDCGKLARLDALLKQLKEGNHRVLLYFQMTRMIDMMEEYLTYRNYTYCRLDGSTKLEDRRDTVHDFQTRSDIFIFLLSTRAGGLGINLTSADTVIFYDSDWNPTIDSQAMDRAHRLGQTKQVTVYRLITRGTIEERIRKRALQKEEVQRVVISGQTSTTTAAGGAVVDFNTRSRENRTKDIALWLADDEQAEEIERREQEALAKGEAAGAKKTRKSVKRAGPAGTMEDMYHEGEGHFEDSAKPSGAATPIEGLPPVTKRKRGISKKAKTMKQRLAIADGEVNV